jgi:hypothetical protein
MIENRFLAGILIGLPISVISVLYALVRREYVIAAMKAGDSSSSGLSDQAFFFLILASFVLVGPFLGVLSALVLGWVSSPSVFRTVALGLGGLMTVAAVASRTPMTAEKVVLNLLVAGGFGLLLPRLIGS